jgi:hypothetical protein
VATLVAGSKNFYFKWKIRSTRKKHHYLPIFYLKGFADDNQQLFIYDKIRNEILEGQNLVANSMKPFEQFSR